MMAMMMVRGCETEPNSSWEMSDCERAHLKNGRIDSKAAESTLYTIYRTVPRYTLANHFLNCSI